MPQNQRTAGGDSVLAAPKPQRRRRSTYLNIAVFLAFVLALVWLIISGGRSGGYHWEWYRIPRYLVRTIEGEYYLGPLLQGLVITLKITFWSFLLMVVLGLTTAILSMSNSVIGRLVALVYVELIRNTPLLIQLFIFYFMLAPVIGLDRYVTGILCLAAFEGAYAAEIFRAGLAAVPRGQWEAGYCVGLTTPRLYRYVVLPQAIRIILPPLTGQSISLIKDSAIVSVIAVYELTTEGRDIIAATLLTFEVWFTVAALYLVLTMSLSFLVSYLEGRLRVGVT
ncbi:MAG: amino acid ABC transporter permease [Alphaproteobacteria bacterium]